MSLVARMTPLAGATMLRTGTITVVGAVTMLVGAARAIIETDLTRVLAYSTVNVLGILMLLFAIGTPAAVPAGLAYLSFAVRAASIAAFTLLTTAVAAHVIA